MRLSVDNVNFKDYNRAGRLVEAELSMMAISTARYHAKVLGVIQNLAKNKGHETIQLTREDLNNIHAVLKLLKENRDNLTLLYKECSIFFNKVAKFNEMPTSFRARNLVGECAQKAAIMKRYCVEQSFDNLKAYLLGGNGLVLDYDVSNKEIQIIRSIWEGDAAKTVYKCLLKAQEDYKKAHSIFKKEVERFYNLIEAKEQERQNDQPLEEEQEDSIGLKEIEDKILTNEETGKSYLVLDIPEEEMTEEQENLQNKTLDNKETGKSYIVLENEMNK